MRTGFTASAALVLSAWGLLVLPAPIRLELYDVQDLTYSLSSFPGVDISLAGSDSWEARPPIVCGEDLAREVQAAMPWTWGEETCIQFQNGLLIVRATRPQQAAITVYLTVWRARTGFLGAVYGMMARLQPTKAA